MNIPVRQVIEFPGGQVSFLEWKSRSDAPTLVFAHANGFNANTYRSILSPLAERFRIVAVDMRGHGMTRLPTEPSLAAGWTIYRDDMLKFLQAVGGENVLLAGHSLGATTMLMAAATRPKNVRAVTLIEPVLPPHVVSIAAVVARLLHREGKMLPLVAAARRRRAWFASQEDAFVGFRGRGGFKTWPNEQMIVDYIQGGTIGDSGGFRLTCAPEWEATNFTVFPFGLAKLGRRVAVPLTALYASKGSSAPQSSLKRLARGHRETQIKHIEGSTHFLPMEKPEIVRAEIVATAQRAGML